MITTKQVLKSIGLTVLGSVPGALVWAAGRSTQGLVLCGLGAFIGFAFSLPGVSLARVAKMTAGTIVAHNVPGPLKQKVLDHFVAETEDYPKPAPNPADVETVSLHDDPPEGAM